MCTKKGTKGTEFDPIIHRIRAEDAMKRLAGLVIAWSMIISGSMTLMAQNEAPPPPIAKKVAKTNNYHGEQVVDHFFWLREKNNPEVIRYLEAENAYTDAVMKPTEA